MKLLIAEDNAMMRGLIRSLVSDLAEDISECADGAEAIDLYAELQPDWVLMDWQMEKVDGIAATRRIIADFPDAHICIVTYHNDEKLKAEAARAGACAFVLKDNLLLVRKVVGGSA